MVSKFGSEVSRKCSYFSVPLSFFNDIKGILNFTKFSIWGRIQEEQLDENASLNHKIYKRTAPLQNPSKEEIRAIIHLLHVKERSHSKNHT